MSVEESVAPSSTRRRVSVASSWAAAAVGAGLVGLYAPQAQFFTWLPIVLAVVVVLTFAVQLSLQNKVGFVLRIIVSLAGALAILVVATLLMLPALLAAA